MALELPPIPPVPAAAAPAADWDKYLRIVALHSHAEQNRAIEANTAAIVAGVASQQQFMATLNALPDGVAFVDVLKLVGMLLKVPVPEI